MRLTLRPLLGFRPHEAPVDRVPVQGYTLTARDRRIEIQGDAAFPPLRLALQRPRARFTVDDYAIADVALPPRRSIAATNRADPCGARVLPRASSHPAAT